MDCILRADGLTKRYGAIAALDNLSLELPSGKIIGLLGPNGSGKTTFLKLCAGLLTPTRGTVEICGKPVGQQTKALVSYLPDRTYLSGGQRVGEQLDFFQDFYTDFDRQRAETMLADLGISTGVRFQTLSKGTREKVQLVLVMSRRAKLYLLDEPIAGVDPAAREFILRTILANYSPESTVLISTHLIADVEPVLDEAVFLKEGRIVRYDSVDHIRETEGKSVDEVFREIFRTVPIGGVWPC